MDVEELTILIVDDMKFSRETLRIAMQKCGVKNVITAENALQALVAMDRHKPNVILVDKMMPKVDGPTLIRKIRAKDAEHQCHSYIILLTADESREALRDAMLSGADHYLYKDSKGEKIINCIEYIDTQYRAKQILQELEEQEQRQREQAAQAQISDSEASAAAIIRNNGPHPAKLSYLIVDDEAFSAESLRRKPKRRLPQVWMSTYTNPPAPAT